MVQDPSDDMVLMVRAKTSRADDLTQSVRAAISRIDKEQLVSRENELPETRGSKTL